jgi:hypothetical protein
MKKHVVFGKRTTMKLTTELFIKRCKIIHNNRYDYSLVEYKNTYTPVTIICPQHGEFQQMPKYHMYGSLCKQCADEARKESRKYHWTEEEIKILKDSFPKRSITYCAKLLKVDHGTVKDKIVELGLEQHIRPCRQVAWGYKDITSERWYTIIYGAKSRNLELKITIEDVWDLYLKQNKKCALTGWPVLYSQDRKETTASLDRIDSTKGYTKDNIQILHRLVNKLKLDCSQDMFLKMCKDIAKNSKNVTTVRKITQWEIDIWNDREVPVYSN